MTAVIVATSAVFAHDFWIEPSALRAPVGTTVKFDLKVGSGKEITVLPRNPERFTKFVIAGPVEVVDVTGVDGSKPAGFVRPSAPGLYVVAYASKHSVVELEAAKFESYLKDEGLENAIKRRSERGTSKSLGRERYARCAKSIVTIGDAPHKGFDRSIGLRLELFPEADPRDMAVGKDGSFRLLFDGKPIEGITVHASPLDHPEIRVAYRTDAEGRVKIALPTGGAWRLNAVHMLELPAGGEQDWESLWASLVFEIGPAPAPTSPPR